MTNQKSVPLLDLRPQYARIRQEVEEAIHRVCNSQHFILGPEVEAFEEVIAKYCQCRFAIGVSSGTDALQVCLMALGVGPSDEVITTPYSFFASTASIVRLGAKPVFVDIDPQTFNMRTDEVAEKLSSKTKAIMPIHLFGQCVEMNPLLEIAKRHNIPIIEDAAQAIGAEYEGKPAGSLGLGGCFSFFPSKNLGAFGDAGMVTTNNPDFAKKVKTLRVHGAEEKYIHTFVGGNFRIDALQAAVLHVKLKYLEDWTKGRKQNAAIYRKLFVDAKLTGTGNSSLSLETNPVVLPYESSRTRHIYNQFVIRARERDKLFQHLREHHIGVEIYYPRPLHLQECFHKFGYHSGDFPESERAAQESLALPIFPELEKQQIEYVVEIIAHFYRKRQNINLNSSV